jgi:hypothetical protein
VENVFSADPSLRLELELELRRRGGNELEGTARLTFRKDDASIEFALPAVEVEGSISGGLEPRVTLDARFARPIGALRLEGVFYGSRLDGSLAGPRVEMRPARWRAERAARPAGGEWEG